jgi:RNA polymerase sigma-70 factor, ECF subfamily
MSGSPSPEERSASEEYAIALSVVRERVKNFVAGKIRFGRDVAEDIAQECTVVLMEEFPDLHDLPSLLRVAFAVARNRIFAYIRSTKKTTPLEGVVEPTIDPPYDDHLRQKQLIDRILSAMLNLGTRCQVIVLMRLQEKSTAEIQTALGGAPLNTVRTWERRCIAQLTVLLRGSLYAG